MRERLILLEASVRGDLEVIDELYSALGSGAAGCDAPEERLWPAIRQRHVLERQIARRTAAVDSVATPRGTSPLSHAGRLVQSERPIALLTDGEPVCTPAAQH